VGLEKVKVGAVAAFLSLFRCRLQINNNSMTEAFYIHREKLLVRCLYYLLTIYQPITL